jgi:hypothetical protein
VQTFALLHKRICNSIRFSPLGGIVPSPDPGEDPGDDPAKVRRWNESPQANWANAAISGHQLSQLRPSPERPLQCEVADDMGKGLGDDPANPQAALPEPGTCPHLCPRPVHKPQI